MFTIFLYVVGAIGTLFAVGFVSLLYENLSLSVKFKKLAYDRESSLTMGDIMKARIIALGPNIKEAVEKSAKSDTKKSKIHPETWDMLQTMMEVSPQHPEINEIEEDDDIVGVLFAGNNYPPELD